MKIKRPIAIVGLAAALALALTAGSCDGSKYTEPFKDADRTSNTNWGPADVITMPDGFSNMATKCDHGNRVYSAYHGDSPYGTISVVAKDPTCPQG